MSKEAYTTRAASEFPLISFKCKKSLIDEFDTAAAEEFATRSEAIRHVLAEYVEGQRQ